MHNLYALQFFIMSCVFKKFKQMGCHSYTLSLTVNSGLLNEVTVKKENTKSLLSLDCI